MLTEYV